MSHRGPEADAYDDALTFLGKLIPIFRQYAAQSPDTPFPALGHLIEDIDCAPVYAFTLEDFQRAVKAVESSHPQMPQGCRYGFQVNVNDFILHDPAALLCDRTLSFTTPLARLRVEHQKTLEAQYRNGVIGDVTDEIRNREKIHASLSVAVNLRTTGARWASITVVGFGEESHFSLLTSGLVLAEGDNNRIFATTWSVETSGASKRATAAVYHDGRFHTRLMQDTALLEATQNDFIKRARGHLGMVAGCLAYVEQPTIYLVEETFGRTRASGRAKPREFLEREVWRLLTPDAVRSLHRQRTDAPGAGTHASPIPHMRAGHTKVLTHPRYTNMRGETIHVRPTYVGDREWAVRNQKYRVVSRHGSKEDQA